MKRLVASLCLLILIVSLGTACRKEKVAPGEMLDPNLDFVARTTVGAEIDLRQTIENNKAVVLIFYQGFFSQYSHDQLKDIQKNYTQLRDSGAEIIAISNDNSEDGKRMEVTVRATFPIVADPSGTLSRIYNVYNLLKDDHVTPATIIFGQDGEVKGLHIGESANDLAYASDILQQLNAMK